MVLGRQPCRHSARAIIGPGQSGETDGEGYFAYSKAMWLLEWCQTRLDDINYHLSKGPKCWEVLWAGVKVPTER